MATDAATEPAGSFETRKDAGDGGPGLVKLWLAAIELADQEERNWRKTAMEAIERFRDEKERKGARFNILYSSIQTQEPAMYNSTPKPDVRRRFGDEDPIGKIAAQAFERSISHCIDEYDFDGVMEAVVHDSLLPGRGVPMVVYEPTVAEDGSVPYESVRCEHVQWDDFRHGPGKRWADVPWVAVRHRITREEAMALNPEVGGKVQLDYIEKLQGDKDQDGKDVPDIFKRLIVWQIWDKAKRQIVFIAPSWKDGPLAVEPDRLKLQGFFPFPRPLYDVMDSSSLVPLVPYDMYKDQAEELDRVTRRIHALVNVLRWRGIRPSQIEELDRLKDAQDGELVPSDSLNALLMAGGDPNKAIWLMPIDKLIQVVRELVIQRESIKQVVFEISGLADIMRGDTDPNETLGAQQIKAQWGSLRMQRRQREVQRVARDLIRMKAEIIGEHFSPQTLALITGIQLPTAEQKAAAQQQAEMAQGQPLPPNVQQVLESPTWEDIKQVMSSDALRSFRVDIETDSTIQADQTRSMQFMSEFVQGLSGFMTAVAPAVETGVMPMDVAADMLTALGRNFRLGKQFEDALDRLGKVARQPQGDKPDPEMAKVQAETQRAEREMAMKEQESQAKLQMERERLELERQRMEQEMALKQQAAQLDAALKERQAAMDADIKRQTAQADMELRARTAQEESARRSEEAALNAELRRQESKDKAKAKKAA